MAKATDVWYDGGTEWPSFLDLKVWVLLKKDSNFVQGKPKYGTKIGIDPFKGLFFFKTFKIGGLYFQLL